MKKNNPFMGGGGAEGVDEILKCFLEVEFSMPQCLRDVSGNVHINTGGFGGIPGMPNVQILEMAAL